MEVLISAAEPKIPEGGGILDPSKESKSSSLDAMFSRKIEFHPARKSYNGFINARSGNFKLETLNPGVDSKRLQGAGARQIGAGGRKVDGSDFLEAGLDPELNFRVTFRKIGAGLENLGNTCFLNSVLQCLTYTEPLAAYLQSGKHQSSCHIAGFCALCAIQKHVSRALQASGRILAPKDLVSNLRCISRNFRNARQEDAHEYMVNLLESMHKCCLPSGVPSESPTAYEKSLVHKIFGGRLRSQVRCLECSHCSDTFDPFLDLSLEIFKADSLQKALNSFTAPELLDGGERQYQCQRCKEKVRACKQLTVHKAPHVLTIHLKRFRAHDPGQKIDKKVYYGSTLDMKPFVSGSYEGGLKYTLYGVLVHYGWSTRSGHYACYCRTSSGMWYSLDDNRVIQVNERKVLEQKAYMLFYVRDRTNVAPRKPINIAQKENSNAILIGKRSFSMLNQNPKEQTQNGPGEKKLHCPGATEAVTPKDLVNEGLLKKAPLKEEKTSEQKTPMSADLVNGGLLKEAPLKEELASQQKKPMKEDLASQQNGGEVVRDRSAPSPNNSSHMQSPAKPVNEKLHPAALSAINNDKASGVKISESSKIGATVYNPASSQKAATDKIVADETSHKVNLVPVAVIPSIVPEASVGKANDKASTVGSTDQVKSPKKPCLEKNQAADAPNANTVDNSLRDKGSVKITEMSSVSAVSNVSVEIDVSVSASKRKSKKASTQFRGLRFFSSRFLQAPLALRRKKHKTSKHKLDLQNLSSELLLNKDGLSKDLGPSTSEKSSGVSLASSLSGKKRKANKSDKKKVEKASVSPMVSEAGEFNNRICLNGSVLATEQQVQKSSGLVSESQQLQPKETNLPKQSEVDASEVKITRLPSQGLRETPVARWGDVDTPVPAMEKESSVIGYVGDEWDEEYDQGRKKKLRLYKHEFGGPNPFQEIASTKFQFGAKENLKKAFKNDKKDGSNSKSWNKPFRIRSNNH